MGLLPGWSGHARHRDDPHRQHDRREPQTRLCCCAGLAASLILTASVLTAEPIRIATYNTELSQRGPGLLLRDIERQTPQVKAVVDTIIQHEPDVLILQGVDYDHRAIAAHALSQLLDEQGLDLPHVYMPPTNTGLPTGIDIDGDGRSDGPRDAQGYGRFLGQASIAVLSRFPVAKHRVQSFHELLWADVADIEGLKDLLPAEAIPLQRLASVSMAAIPITLPEQELWLLALHATPPVFDGPEDRNGHRNAAENTFWLRFLSGDFGSNIGEFFLIGGQLNVDPSAGEGHRKALARVLNDPQLQDPFSNWPTVDRHTVTYKRVGKLRVSYLLPSVSLRVADLGMSADERPEGDTKLSRHRLLWVDVELPP